MFVMSNMEQMYPDECFNFYIRFSLEVFVCASWKYNAHYERREEAWTANNNGQKRRHSFKTLWKIALFSCSGRFETLFRSILCSSHTWLFVSVCLKITFNEIVSKCISISQTSNACWPGIACVFVWVTTLPPFQMHVDHFKLSSAHVCLALFMRNVDLSNDITVDGVTVCLPTRTIKVHWFYGARRHPVTRVHLH